MLECPRVTAVGERRPMRRRKISRGEGTALQTECVRGYSQQIMYFSQVIVSGKLSIKNVGFVEKMDTFHVFGDNFG